VAGERPVTPSATIRAARASDLAPLARSLAGQPLLERYGTDAAALERSLSSALARGDGLAVAEEAGAPRGLAWFLVEGTFALGGYLKLIALAPGAEGRGLGGALLDEVERQVAARSRHLFLLVSHFNDGARRFYARRGYREAGALPSLVREGIDEVVMWRRL
jgi:ribosomal protein S18 acetylase RimI-like enzyme